MYAELPGIGACPHCRAYIWVDQIIDEERLFYKPLRFLPVLRLRRLNYEKYCDALEKNKYDSVKMEIELRRYAWRAWNDRLLDRPHGEAASGGIFTSWPVLLVPAVIWLLIKGHTTVGIIVISPVLFSMVFLVASSVFWKARSFLKRRGGNRPVFHGPPGDKSYFDGNLKRLFELLGEDEDEVLEKAEIARELGWFDVAEKLLTRPVPPKQRDAWNIIDAQVRARNREVVKIREPGPFPKPPTLQDP
jgi:hypothetical protein